MLPSFAEVRKTTLASFHTFLADAFETTTLPGISFKLLRREGDASVPFSEDAPFQWEDSLYLWVTVNDLCGGTDGYFMMNDDVDREYWQEDIIPLDRCKPIRKLLVDGLDVGYHWSFRRSAGQPGCINILYGLLAGSVAKLTGGVVFSDDCAWDFGRMPLIGDEFLRQYMHMDDSLSGYAVETVDLSLKLAKEEVEEWANVDVGRSGKMIGS